MPFTAPATACYWLRWEYEAVTYQKQYCFQIGETIQFLWPFQTYGVFVFQFLDADFVPVLFDIEGVEYDCFNAIGIPTFEIPEEELEELLALCDDPFGLLDIEFIGRGDLEVLAWEVEPPPGGGGDWDLEAEMIGRGDLELLAIDVNDQPDHELEAEAIGRGDLELTHLVLGDPPGFAYLLNEEDNVMQAFSFRKLRPAYTGYCCRIERWADNATLDVGFSGGWLDETAVNLFLMGTDGGIRIWYNQMGAGGDWEQPSALLQLQIGFSGGVIKKSIGAIPYTAAYCNAAMMFDNSSGVGPWFGTSHSASLVVHTDGDTNPYHIHNPGASNYAGRGNSMPIAHYANAGSPEYWANNVYQLGITANAYRAYVVPNTCHVWMNALDLSTWTETSFGETFNGYLFEYVLFNLNMTAQRVAKTALTMPVYNL